MNGMSRQAIPGDPRQCEARSRVTLQRCGRWRLIGSRFCHIHGGRRERDRKRLVDVSRLPVFYSKFLGPTISEAVSQAVGIAPSDQLSLVEEIGILRTMTGECLQLWAATEALPEGDKKQEARAMARLMAIEMMREVKSFTETAQKMHLAAGDKFSIHNLDALCKQMTRVAYEAFGDDPRAKVFDEMLKNIRLPSRDGSEGTSLTPDQDVSEMDDTIPREPPNEN